MTTELRILLKLRDALCIEPQIMQTLLKQLNDLKRLLDNDDCSTITLVIQQGIRDRTLQPYLTEYNKRYASLY